MTKNVEKLLKESEQKKGHWIQSYPDIEPNPMYMYSICSVCGGEQSIRYDLPFCPWCGSKNGEVERLKG